ncbi:MAG TPA: phosphotransferase, partial [Ktedonobacterales bacterium]|nr:phosphotransferase [Ktedonobacterales bacterium]
MLRQYQWPWEEHDLNRLQKEQHVHALLHRVGVPVPAILAHSERPGQSAVLMDYMPGEVLGDISPCLSDDERRQAWRSCGQILRRAHAISYPAGTYGIIVGDHIQPFAEHSSWEGEAPSWGHCQIHMIVDHFHQLSKKKLELAHIDQELQRTLAASLPFLNRTPPTLLHNDSHPWNVLVRPMGEQWQCAAWLDWEYAWVG